MKTKLIYSLAFALAVTLATTGCRHKPVNVTPMTPGQTPTLPVEPGPGTTRYQVPEPTPPYTPPGNPNEHGIPLPPGGFD